MRSAFIFAVFTALLRAVFFYSLLNAVLSSFYSEQYKTITRTRKMQNRAVLAVDYNYL